MTSDLHMLRKLVADRIERLIAFLDVIESDCDLEPSLAGYSLGMDDCEGDPSETGIADMDGLLEQISDHYHPP